MIKKQGSARQWLIGGLAAITATAGLVIGAAGPAHADPITTLVGAGSDTTQDILDAIAIQVGGGVVGSWDAVNPVDHVTAHEAIAPKAGCTMTRPNGSGEGVSALRKSLNAATAAVQLADPPEPGCVDFARSSSGPGTNASPTGQLVYVPFALDAVAITTGPAVATGTSVATLITDADLFSVTDLITMYTTGVGVTPAGATKQYVPDGTVTDATHQPVHLYVPQAGSGTRNFWLGQMTLPTSGALPAWVHDTIVGTTTIVQEHDGSAYATDPIGFGPFSIAQWVSQRNGHNDRRHDAVLHNLNGVTPLTGTSLNSAYPIKREVYNVVLFSRVTSVATADKQFVSTFNGATSSICSNALNILSYGFGLLNAAPLGHTCGQVAVNLRAFDTL